VDGSNAHAFFTSKIFPLMIPSMALLMASSTQSSQPEFQNGNPSETLWVKSNVLSTINTLLRQDFSSVANQVLSAVVHLVIIEVSNPPSRDIEKAERFSKWWWGNSASLWAHLNGARQMIKLQGGFNCLSNSVLARNIILSGSQIFYCFNN
jgi:hypothetical protein